MPTKMSNRTRSSTKNQGVFGALVAALIFTAAIGSGGCESAVVVGAAAAAAVPSANGENTFGTVQISTQSSPSTAKKARRMMPMLGNVGVGDGGSTFESALHHLRIISSTPVESEPQAPPLLSSSSSSSSLLGGAKPSSKYTSISSAVSSSSRLLDRCADYLYAPQCVADSRCGWCCNTTAVQRFVSSLLPNDGDGGGLSSWGGGGGGGGAFDDNNNNSSNKNGGDGAAATTNTDGANSHPLRHTPISSCVDLNAHPTAFDACGFVSLDVDSEKSNKKKKKMMPLMLTSRHYNATASHEVRLEGSDGVSHHFLPLSSAGGQSKAGDSFNNNSINNNDDADGDDNSKNSSIFEAPTCGANVCQRIRAGAAVFSSSAPSFSSSAGGGDNSEEAASRGVVTTLRTPAEICRQCVSVGMCYYCLSLSRCVGPRDYCPGGKIVNSCDAPPSDDEGGATLFGISLTTCAEVITVDVRFAIVLTGRPTRKRSNKLQDNPQSSHWERNCARKLFLESISVVSLALYTVNTATIRSYAAFYRIMGRAINELTRTNRKGN